VNGLEPHWGHFKKSFYLVGFFIFYFYSNLQDACNKAVTKKMMIYTLSGV
jgi:hypothetical protein